MTENETKKSGGCLGCIAAGVVLFMLLIIAWEILVGSHSRHPHYRSLTEALIANIGMGLETYSSDFDGKYPPDTLNGPVYMANGEKIKNCAQALCYFLESHCISDDGRKSGYYLTFKPRNKLKKGKDTIKEANLPEGLKLKISIDYIIDPYGNPLFYDERKSENAETGLNNEFFLVISGGKKDKNPNIDMPKAAPGDWSMFKEEQLKNIDFTKEIYELDGIPYDKYEEIMFDDVINK